MTITTQTLVQSSATIVQILTLRKDDVYKRFDKPTYSEVIALKYGVVMSVDHNGTDAMIVALEFDPVSTSAPAMKVWATGTEMKLFAAEPEEVIAGFSQLRERMQKEIDMARDSLTSKLQIQANLEQVLERESAKALRMPELVDFSIQAQSITSDGM